MDEVLLARLQFASTTLFHFIFVPLSIGLAFLIAIMQTLYHVKKEEIYLKMTKFWAIFFLINFAVGVVTGILQEFQFGMNWSEYSRFVGDIFGAPLAIEALLAFFLESTFIGIWVFGWGRVPKWVHLLSIWLVSFGTMLSAFWILAANSFMQNPVGYVLEGGRAEMNDIAAVLLNEKLWVAFPHTVFASLATGAFFVTGVSAWNYMKNRDMEFYKRSMNIGLIVALITSAALAITGHSQATHLMHAQPMKMAAAEGLWEDSGDPAAWTVVANIDVENRDTTFRIDIPYALSYLTYGEFSGAVKGMNTLEAELIAEHGEGNYIPPVKTTFWTFRIMAGLGGVLVLVAALGLWFSYRGTLQQKGWFLKLLILTIFIPYISNSAGWIMSEVGRQPWVVNGLLETAAAVSPNVTAGQILFSLIAFSTIYAILGILMVILFIKYIKRGHHEEPKADVSATDPFEGGAK